MVLVACALQTPKLINKYWVSMRNDKIAQNFTEFISAVAKGYSWGLHGSFGSFLRPGGSRKLRNTIKTTTVVLGLKILSQAFPV